LVIQISFLFRIEVVIFEPTYKEEEFFQSRVIESIDEFNNTSGVIILNRISPKLDDVAEKVFTRDLFGRD